MRGKLILILKFLMRLMFLLTITVIVFAKKMMAYLDTSELGVILDLLDDYKSLIPVEQIGEQELLVYKAIYNLNEYYLSILIVISIIWVTTEVIIILNSKNRRFKHE